MIPLSPPEANKRLPSRNLWLPWVAALLVFIAGVACLETMWRILGYTPSVTDDEALWAQQRARVETASAESLVVLGRSRILQAFVKEPFLDAGFDETVQLALGAYHPLATLRDVAEETTFAGSVLVDLSAESLLPELWDQQQEYVEYFRENWGPVTGLTRTIRTVLQSRFTILLSDLLLQRVGPDLLRGEPPPQFLWNLPDRIQVVDYERVNLEEFTEIQLKKISDNIDSYVKLDGYQNWRQALPEIEHWVRQIQARGGEVLFIRMPTSGAYYALEERHFPRSQFWDAFAEQTAADTLHFKDVPELADLNCAEGTHLHRQDAIFVSQWLAGYMSEKYLDNQEHP